jgi:hypothetical protein
MHWDTAATCIKGTGRTWPCGFVITVGDQNGQPVADGTTISLVSDTGVIVGDTLGGQVAGACQTKNAQCTGKYFGNDAYPVGWHRVIAFADGVDAPTGYPITRDGSWVDTGSNVVFSVAGGSDNYIRNCLPDIEGPLLDINGNPVLDANGAPILIPSPSNRCHPL